MAGKFNRNSVSPRPARMAALALLAGGSPSYRYTRPALAATAAKPPAATSRGAGFIGPARPAGHCGNHLAPPPSLAPTCKRDQFTFGSPQGISATPYPAAIARSPRGGAIDPREYELRRRARWCIRDESPKVEPPFANRLMAPTHPAPSHVQRVLPPAIAKLQDRVHGAVSAKAQRVKVAKHGFGSWGGPGASGDGA